MWKNIIQFSIDMYTHNVGKISDIILVTTMMCTYSIMDSTWGKIVPIPWENDLSANVIIGGFLSSTRITPSYDILAFVKTRDVNPDSRGKSNLGQKYRTTVTLSNKTMAFANMDKIMFCAIIIMNLHCCVYNVAANLRNFIIVGRNVFLLIIEQQATRRILIILHNDDTVWLYHETGLLFTKFNYSMHAWNESFWAIWDKQWFSNIRLFWCFCNSSAMSSLRILNSNNILFLYIIRVYFNNVTIFILNIAIVGKYVYSERNIWLKMDKSEDSD